MSNRHKYSVNDIFESPVSITSIIITGKLMERSLTGQWKYKIKHVSRGITRIVGENEFDSYLRTGWAYIPFNKTKKHFVEEKQEVEEGVEYVCTCIL